MTTPDPIPEAIQYYGKNQPLPDQRLLKAGPLSVIYENGAIRYIKLNGFEVIRMIYSAVRNHNWDTVIPTIKEEKIRDLGNSFFIEYDAEYREGDIHFVCKYRIEGTEKAEIRFNMEGQALSSFRKNRIGFCVLHPVEECVGKLCEILDGKGKKTSGHFPQQISPHQPFKQIKSMRWQLGENFFAKIEFDGDVFETEDQRNWTDASFKTYSTPLDIPFPVMIPAGTAVKQSVKISLEGRSSPIADTGKAKGLVFYFSPDQKVPVPAIGIARSGEVNGLSPEDAGKISSLGFQHYRIDVRLFEEGWIEDLQKAVDEAQKLKLKLEIILHFPRGNFEALLTAFINEGNNCRADIYSILLLLEREKTSPASLVDAVTPKLRQAFPHALLGGGTDIYFTEINRNRPDLSQLDFMSFSINPQVHAFDNSSLTETLQAQAYVVRSAQKIWPGKSVHVSPVSLKPRFNPNATGPEPEPLPGELPLQTDVRQMSLFGAGWTLGSLKYLAEAGANRVTYFETVGTRGILMGKNSPDFPEFPVPYKIFPMFAVFKAVLEFSGAEVLISKSSEPLQFEGMVLRADKKLRIILANFLNREISISIPSVEGRFKIRQLNVDILMHGDWLDNYSTSSASVSKNKNDLSITLPPYAIAILDGDAYPENSLL